MRLGPVRDERGIISGFLIRLAVFFAVLVLAVNEGGQIVLAQLRASDAASAAASAAAGTFKSTRNFPQAHAAAVTAAAESNATARVTKLTIAPDGSATVTVTNTAHTVLIRRISFLRKYGIQHSTEESAAPS